MPANPLETRKSRIVFLLLLSLVGCAAYAPKETSFESTALPKPSSTEAIIYVYRTDRIEGYASQRVASLGDSQSVSLDHQCFTWFTAKPGKQVISSDIPWSKRSLLHEYKPTTTTIDVQPGRTYFVHLAIGVFPRGQRPTGCRRCAGSPPSRASAHRRASRAASCLTGTLSDSCRTCRSSPSLPAMSRKSLATPS